MPGFCGLCLTVFLLVSFVVFVGCDCNCFALLTCLFCVGGCAWIVCLRSFGLNLCLQVVWFSVVDCLC